MGAEQSILTNSEFMFQNTNCRIVVVGPKNGDTSLTELANLPKEARILATGMNLEELKKDGDVFAEVFNDHNVIPFGDMLFRRMCC